MRWVALLSRFLDAQAALGLEFRVFSDDPLRSNTEVVGVHPALSPELTASAAASVGVNLIDLERQEISEITPSESAVRYAKWFTEGDPYEALEAIEVGRRWSQYMDSDVASAAAELATVEATRESVDRTKLGRALVAITALASAGQSDELEVYGDELADLVASSAPTDLSDLLSINQALWASFAAGDDQLAQSLALSALEWAAAQPALASGWADALRLRPELRWHDADSRTHAAGLIASVVNAGSTGNLPALFSLAKALNTDVGENLIAPAIDRLVERWANEPALSGQATGWMQQPAVTAGLATVLDSRLNNADPAAEQSLSSGAWDWLLPLPWKIDPANPVSRWFGQRELRTANAARRAEVLEISQPNVPGSAWRLFLLTPNGLHPDEVAAWIRTHKSLDAGLANEIERVLASADRFPEWQQGGGARVLHELGKLASNPSAQLAARSAEQTRIVALFDRATKEKDQVPNKALVGLAQQFAGKLNSLYTNWIVKAVLESEDTANAVALAEGQGRSSVIAAFVEVLDRQLRAATADALLSAVRVLDPPFGPWFEATRTVLTAVWDDRANEAIKERLLTSVKGRLGPDENSRLDEYLEGQSKGRFTRGVLRSAKSIFGNKDN
jgi:hypothetical protein